MRKKIILLLSFFLLGICTGFLTQLTLPQNQINLLVSPLADLTKKQENIGFLPYWLIEQANFASYQGYINELTYFGLTIGPDGYIQKLTKPNEEEPGWTTFKNKVKTIFSQLKQDRIKTSLLIFSADEKVISALVDHPILSAHNLITEVVPLMKEVGFNNLHLDIESFQTASLASQLNYAEFLTEVKKGLKENKLGHLIVEITPESLIKERLTNASLISPIADFIVLMAYDYHYFHSPISGPVAPLGGAGLVWEYDVEKAVKIALSSIPADKLILGIPLYGYEWETLTNKPLSAVIPQSAKVASLKRISQMLPSCQDCQSGTEEFSQQPYLIIPENNYFRQIFYEDKTSIAKKKQLIKKYQLAGLAFWALGYEDETIFGQKEK